MTKEIVKFSLLLLLLALFSQAMSLLFENSLYAQSPYQYPILVFLAVITFSSYGFLAFKKAKPEKTVRYILIIVILKLIVSIGFIVTLLLIDSEYRNANVVFFLTNYFFFTIAELYNLFRKMKTNMHVWLKLLFNSKLNLNLFFFENDISTFAV